jgi:hypothetical protein
MPRRNTILALAALVLLAAPAVLFSQGTPAADFAGIWTLDKDALGAEMRYPFTSPPIAGVARGICLAI